MVTQPAITTVDGAPLAVIPTFYFDTVNPAGVVGVAIERTETGFALRERWSAPHRSAQEARSRFREHTGRVALLDVAGTTYAVLADPGSHADGILYVIDTRTGEVAARAALDGAGHKYIEPAIIDGNVYVTSCVDPFDGPTHLEAWAVGAP